MRKIFTLSIVSIMLVSIAPGGAQNAPHVLRFADGQDVTHLNSLLITTYPESYTAQLTGAFLTRLDAHLNPVPDLAREIPTQQNGGISRDGKIIVFHLRADLKWSDGKPLTARDVIYTTNIVIGKNTPVASTVGWDQISAAEPVGTDGVKFRLRAPYGPAVTTFFSSGNDYAILPEHLFSQTPDIKTSRFNDLPVGAGPFRYISFTRGNRVVMEANPYYWRGRPKLDRIEYLFIPDENTVTTQLLTGEIDLAIRQQPTQSARTEHVSALRFIRTPSLNSGFIGFNEMRPPFDDVRVRLALRLAIDRDAILRTIYHGSGTVNDDLVSVLDPFYGPSFPTVQPDIVKAGTLLDAAGWRLVKGARVREGHALRVDLLGLTGNQIAMNITELVRAQWERVGVGVDLRTLGAALVFSPGGILARGAYGARIYGQGMTSDALLNAYSCHAIPPQGFNYSRFCDKRVDALLSQGDSSYDVRIRMRDYLAARRLIAAAAPVIPTVHRVDVHVARDGVSGFHPNGATLFDEVMDLDVKR